MIHFIHNVSHGGGGEYIAATEVKVIQRCRCGVTHTHTQSHTRAYTNTHTDHHTHSFLDLTVEIYFGNKSVLQCALF